ncbi:MAG: type III polyketide synthase [Actinomycetota bacterium]|nr:type III polyketide synthase [Actinomycetota bacterium]
MTATIAGIGSALPPPMSQAELWEDFFCEHYADAAVARQVWRSAGIQTRHGVVNPAYDDISEASTGARMRRFLAEAVPLGKEAVSRALEDAGVGAGQIGLLAVVSSTGYAAPGLDVILARDLAMSADVQRLHLGHMGCYAALPALRAAMDFVTARRQPAVVLSVELTSLHVQPATDTARGAAPTPEDRQQMVAHALFGDAAAAAVLCPGPGGLAVVDVTACTDTAAAAEMTWEVTDHGFRMGLSPRVPGILAGHVRPVVRRLLDRHGLTIDDVDHWAVHPGGRRIVEVVGAALDLDDEDLAASYDVLRDMGNCSSAAVLLVLDRLRTAHRLRAGGWVVAMAFGPGLTLYAALLRQTPDYPWGGGATEEKPTTGSGDRR